MDPSTGFSAPHTEHRRNLVGHQTEGRRRPPHRGGDGTMLKGGLLWLIGIPLPIILLLWFFGVF
ncbi:MAG: hypothetical protein PGN25_12140 [Methylorubrum populi]